MRTKIIPIGIAILGVLLIASSFISFEDVHANLEMDIKKSRVIMPAAHNVYADEDALDGQYYLFKSRLTNSSDQTLKDVKVSYRIPGFIEWTELDVVGEMFPGQSATFACYPKFPESITERTTSSTEKAEIKVEWDGMKEDDFIEEEFSFKLASRKEFMFTNIPADEIAGWNDGFDNKDLLACFVTPNDPIVQYYTQNVQEKILKGDKASVVQEPKEGVRFMTGLYDATLASHMVYSGTKMIPTDLKDFSMASQENRLPREVITGNTGLCLELSLMYASVMMNAGLEPIIYMVPGHAYPGFKMNGQYYAIEATGIGGEGLNSIVSSEKALEAGMKQLETFFKQAQSGDPRYQIVDIGAARQQGVAPMALKDDSFLRKKVDDIVASWSNSGQPVMDNQNSLQPSNTINTNGTNSWTSRSTGNYSIQLPGTWQRQVNPIPDFPALVLNAMSPDQTIGVSVYDLLTSDPNQAMNSVKQALSGYGMQVQYQLNGNQVSGITYSNNGNFAWAGKLLSTDRGLRIVTVGAPDYLYEQKMNEINQLFNSIR